MLLCLVVEMAGCAAHPPPGRRVAAGNGPPALPAERDPLTGLPHRDGLRSWVDGWCMRNPDRSLAVLFIDPDGFKEVNTAGPSDRGPGPAPDRPSAVRSSRRRGLDDRTARRRRVRRGAGNGPRLALAGLTTMVHTPGPRTHPDRRPGCAVQQLHRDRRLARKMAKPLDNVCWSTLTSRRALPSRSKPTRGAVRSGDGRRGRSSPAVGQGPAGSPCACPTRTSTWSTSPRWTCVPDRWSPQKPRPLARCQRPHDPPMEFIPMAGCRE